MHQEVTSDYSTNGFTIIPNFYSLDYISALISQLETQKVFEFNFVDNDSHNLYKSIDAIRALAESDELISIAKAIIGSAAHPFYAILLDKTNEHNWALDWHQDIKIAVKTKQETDGYYNWTMEANIPHVTPPANVLSKLLYLRVHLDDCDSTNGALQVIPKTHQLGILDANNITNIVATHTTIDCKIKKKAAF